jgi:S-formylglutathione hydrolase FrmB
LLGGGRDGEQRGGHERQPRGDDRHRSYDPRIDAVADIPITTWWPVGAVIGLLALIAFVAAIRWRRLPRILAIVLCVVLYTAEAGSIVNAHFEYYRTVGEVLGAGGSDESSLAEAEQEAGTIPATGKVVPLPIPATRSGFAARTALAYLPPIWFARDRPALPVVLLLHGTPGTPTDWTDGGLAPATADAWAAQNGGTAPVLVMPDINGSLTGDSECVDSPRGNVETYLTVDVPAAATQTLGTLRPGPGWAVAGLSEGGTCSIMLALRHPDLFTAFGDFGGLVGPRVGETNADTADTVSELFGGSQQAFLAHEPAALLRNGRFPRLGGWFQVGADDDQPYQAIQQLEPLAHAAGIATCSVVMPGEGHTFVVWSDAFRQALPFFAKRLGLPPEPAVNPPPCRE